MRFRRMTRMVSFRVSEAEFEQLRSESEAEGARSVSDYARSSLCRGATRTGGERRMQELNEGIELLSGDIRRLSELIEAPQRLQNGYGTVAPNQGAISDLQSGLDMREKSVASQR
jgi:hypothetical protein